MEKRRPLSIRQTLWLVIALTVASTVLGASALYSYQLYQAGQHAEQLRVQTIAETYAAQSAPFLLSGKRTEMTAFIDELAWHPTTCLLVVLDARHKPVVIRGTKSLLGQYLTLPGASASPENSKAWRIPGDPDQDLPELHLAASPIRSAGSVESLGTLVYAARPSQAAGVTSEEVWTFFANLMAIAAVGIVLGFWWLKRRVIDPLALLGQQSCVRHGSEAVASLPVNRRDEIGALARVLNEMHVNLDEWRGRAVRLEQSVDERVAAQTRKITRELKLVEKQTWTDPLTKLGNRRLLEEKFSEIFLAQQEAGEDLSIVMIDIDHFKTLNDTLGHKAGDEVLVFVGELLQQCLRAQDIAIRYGGDEFILILPAVSAQDARVIADRTIVLFSQRAKLWDSNPKPSMSAGIASIWHHQPAMADNILRMADEALYSVKRAGKGRSAIYRRSRQSICTP